MTFYGIPDKEKADRVYQLLSEIREIYDSYGMRSFSADNLLALFRALTYSTDKKFMEAFGRYAETYVPGYAIVWVPYVGFHPLGACAAERSARQS